MSTWKCFISTKALIYPFLLNGPLWPLKITMYYHNLQHHVRNYSAHFCASACLSSLCIFSWSCRKFDKMLLKDRNKQAIMMVKMIFWEFLLVIICMLFVRVCGHLFVIGKDLVVERDFACQRQWCRIWTTFSFAFHFFQVWSFITRGYGGVAIERARGGSLCSLLG